MVVPTQAERNLFFIPFIVNSLSLIDSVKPAFREIVVVVFKVSNEVFLLVWVQHMETTLQTVIIGDHCINNRCSR